MVDPFNAREVLNLCHGNGRLWRGADVRFPLHFDATQAVSLFGQKGPFPPSRPAFRTARSAAAFIWLMGPDERYCLRYRRRAVERA